MNRIPAGRQLSFSRFASLTNLSRYDVYLLLSCLTYLILVATQLNETNIGYNDQVFLYTSWRFADGAVLYKDILLGYPPLISVVGALFLRITSSYLQLKIVNLLLYVAATVLVYRLSFKLLGGKRVALVSALVYLILPIRYGLAPAFYPDNYVLLFVLFSIVLLLNHTPRSILLSSIFSILALFTKYTVLPLIIGSIFYLQIKDRGLLKYYLLPLLASTLSLTAVLQVYSQGNFVPQTLAMPASSWSWSNLGHLLDGLRNIGRWEGVFIALFLPGIVLYMKQKGPKEHLVLLLPFSFLPVFFMLHPGTGEYVFMFAEPWIALFAVYGVMKIHSRASARIVRLKSVLKVGMLLLLLAASFRTVLVYDKTSGWKDRDQIISDYSRAVRMYSGPEDMILAPSMLAFKSERRIALEMADVAYLGESYQHGDVYAHGVVKTISGMLERKQITVIVPQGYYRLARSYNYSDGTFRAYTFPFDLPEVANLILANYRP